MRPKRSHRPAYIISRENTLRSRSAFPNRCSLDFKAGGKKRWAVARPGVAAEPVRHTLPGQLIVSLTSHPPRFPMLGQALRSLLEQDMRPDAVVLWLARHEFAALPVEILRMDGLTIRQC